MNTSGTKARAKRKAFICGRPSYICACRIFIYKGTSGLIFILFLIFVRKRCTIYKKLIAFASTIELKPKAWEEWVTPQEHGKSCFSHCLYVCRSRTQLNSQSCWTSAPGLCCRTAGLNQLGFSRKRCSPWENHCAYSSSVENTYKDWQRIMPTTHDLPETAELHSTRPRRTNFRPLPASVSFGLKAKVTRFGAKKTERVVIEALVIFRADRSIFWPFSSSWRF